MSRNAESAETDEKSILGRRGYMRALGAVAASVGVLGTMTRDASAAEYETIELSEGEQRSFSVGSGETLENLLIDVRAPGADVHIDASGDDWTVRNIGVQGTVDQGSNSGGFSNFLSMVGNGTVENVYFGDGVEAGHGHRRGAVGSAAGHSGHIEVRNAYIAGWSDNGMYAAGSGRVRPPGTTDGGGGTYELVDCYFRDNNISHIRMSSGGSSVTGCVFENTGSVPENENGDVNSRGIYTGYGDPAQVITVSDCDFALTGQDTNGAASALVSGTHGTYGECTTIEAKNSQIRGDTAGGNVDVGSNVGNSPDTSLPAGTPKTAEEAASR
jgi:hypothetical protein